MSTSDNDGDGPGEALTNTVANTYDAKGRLALVLSETRHEDGSLQSSVRKTITYSKTTVTETTEYDFNGDTVVDQIVVTTAPA